MILVPRSETTTQMVTEWNNCGNSSDLKVLLCGSKHSLGPREEGLWKVVALRIESSHGLVSRMPMLIEGIRTTSWSLCKGILTPRRSPP